MKNKILKISAAAFAGAEIILSILVQTTSGTQNTLVSYGAIILSCVFCILLFTKSFNYALTQAGLIFTVLADLFLVVLNPIMQIPAMICFSFTQIFYFLRLYLWQGSAMRRRHLIARCALTVVAMLATVIVLGEKTDALSLISLFYYANLIMNIAVAFSQHRRSLLFPLGLLLFLLCDTVIGLNVMAKSYIASAEDSLIMKIINPGFNLAWVFYVPSQTLIPLSLLEGLIRRE